MRWRLANGPKPITYDVDAKGCHICTSDGRTNGYPQRHTGRIDGKNCVKKVCRIVWEQANGPVPAGMVMRHLCHTRACVNLAHLAIGTPADNQRDSALIGKNSSPLTVEQATAIRTASDAREAIALAAEWGMSRQCALNIREGRSWKHLDVPVPPPPIRPAPAYSGAQLREMRHGAGLTVRMMAELSGLHFTHISKMENGARPVTVEFERRYLDALQQPKPLRTARRRGRPRKQQLAAAGLRRLFTVL